MSEVHYFGNEFRTLSVILFIMRLFPSMRYLLLKWHVFCRLNIFDIDSSNSELLVTLHIFILSVVSLSSFKSKFNIVKIFHRYRHAGDGERSISLLLILLEVLSM